MRIPKNRTCNYCKQPIPDNFPYCPCKKANTRNVISEYMDKHNLRGATKAQCLKHLEDKGIRLPEHLRES